jgi:hypothetical protein
MYKTHFNYAATAARRHVKPGVLSAQVNLNGTNPILAASLIALVGIGVYSIKKAVDKATRKEGNGNG